MPPKNHCPGCKLRSIRHRNYGYASSCRIVFARQIVIFDSKAGLGWVLRTFSSM